MASFVAVEVETANASTAAICQLGAALYDGSELVRSWAWPIRPADTEAFDPINVRLHGIRREDVVGARSFAEEAPQVRLCSTPVYRGVGRLNDASCGSTSRKHMPLVSGAAASGKSAGTLTVRVVLGFP